MNPTLVEIEALARQAGDILRALFGHQYHVDYKGEIDPVTEADRRSEAFLLGHIQSRFPSHRIVAEESGLQGGKDCNLWYIDPLDGTVNFAHGLPIFSVSIGYQEDGEIRLGVVYDPVRNECFSAEKGRGAWLNGYPIRVSAATLLNESLLTTGFAYDIRTNPETNLDYYNRFSLQTQGVRCLGSAALDLCYVAAGRLDGYWEFRLNPWDVAAGALIAQEAGALVTNISGEKDFLSAPQSILAANPAIYSQMQSVLNKDD